MRPARAFTRTTVFGFDLAERLSGTFYFHADARRERAIRITLALHASGLRRFARERTMIASGEIVAEDLAGGRANEAARPIWGEVRWKLLDQKRVPYDLAFDGNDGRRYLLRGQRDFFVHDVAGSLATMATSLYLAKPARAGEGGGAEGEGDEEIGRAFLAFEPRIELPALLRSFRPRLSRG